MMPLILFQLDQSTS